VRVLGWEGEHFVLRADLDRMLHASRPPRPQLSLLADLDPYTMGFRGVPGCWTTHCTTSSTTAAAMPPASCSLAAGSPGSGT
jgi:hypothetical protein